VCIHTDIVFALIAPIFYRVCVQVTAIAFLGHLANRGFYLINRDCAYTPSRVSRVTGHPPAGIRYKFGVPKVGTVLLNFNNLLEDPYGSAVARARLGGESA